MGGSLFTWFQEGGWCMYPLLALSIAALVVIIERTVTLSRARVDTAELMTQVRSALLRKEMRQALRVCDAFRGPLAAIVKAGLLRHGKPLPDIEKSMENAALREMSALERFLPALSAIGAIAPILGFLGTVVGMIDSFGVLSDQGLGNPALLARGVKAALICTAFGLIISVPALCFYHWFAALAARFVREMETGANILLETLSEMEAGERQEKA